MQIPFTARSARLRSDAKVKCKAQVVSKDGLSAVRVTHKNQLWALLLPVATQGVWLLEPFPRPTASTPSCIRELWNEDSAFGALYGLATRSRASGSEAWQPLVPRRQLSLRRPTTLTWRNTSSSAAAFGAAQGQASRVRPSHARLMTRDVRTEKASLRLASLSRLSLSLSLS